MLQGHFEAFHEYLPVAGANYYTSDKFNARMGKWDQLAIFAVVEKQVGAGSLVVQIEHSGDAIHWANKQLAAEMNTSLFPAYASDDGTRPSLPHVRLRINPGFTGYVKIVVARRDADSDHVADTAPSFHRHDKELPPSWEKGARLADETFGMDAVGDKERRDENPHWAKAAEVVDETFGGRRGFFDF